MSSRYDGWRLRRYWRAAAKRAERRFWRGGYDDRDLMMANTPRADWLDAQGRYQ